MVTNTSSNSKTRLSKRANGQIFFFTFTNELNILPSSAFLSNTVICLQNIEITSTVGQNAISDKKDNDI